MSKGIWYAIAAYLCWGLFPIYWKLLSSVPSSQILCHRIVWSFITLVIVLLAFKQFRTFCGEMFSWKVINIYFWAAILIGINWFLYIWSVNNGHIVEASLGYFINPLFSVLIGVLFFREKLRLRQWISIALATAGVVYLTLSLGSLPWIALGLALSFAVYGLVKKIAPLNSLNGLTIETILLLLPAAGFLFLEDFRGGGAFMHGGVFKDALMICAGIVTAMPLLFFASAAKRIPLSYMGILQYISPTTQFLLGVFIYKEVFTMDKLIGYIFVWMALIIFTFDSFAVYRVMAAETAKTD